MSEKLSQTFPETNRSPNVKSTAGLEGSKDPQSSKKESVDEDFLHRASCTELEQMLRKVKYG